MIFFTLAPLSCRGLDWNPTQATLPVISPACEARQGDAERKRPLNLRMNSFRITHATLNSISGRHRSGFQFNAL